jgi:hypothetical protein
MPSYSARNHRDNDAKCPTSEPEASQPPAWSSIRTARCLCWAGSIIRFVQVIVLQALDEYQYKTRGVDITEMHRQVAEVDGEVVNGVV